MRSLKLFRSLIPSWRFFDQRGEAVILEYRMSLPLGEFTPWKNALDERAPRNLILNARGNYLLACHTLLQQLIDDLDEWDENRMEEFQESVSFRLVVNLVKERIAKQEPSPHPDFRFQFRVRAPEDVLISQELLWN